MTMTRHILACLLVLLASRAVLAAARGLDVFFIDVEGGAATLIVTPAGESVLIDTGNPGGRDADRIFRAAQDAGLKQIDHLIVTHYHVDHFGGAPELARLMPVRKLYDNADQNVAREKPPADYFAMKTEQRILLSAGDEVPLQPVTGGATPRLRCLGARKAFIDPPAGAKPNPFASEARGKQLDLSDNANSIVLLLEFGGFRFFHGADLTWNLERDLATPVNRAGTVDVFQVNHHGLDFSNNPVLVKAMAPTVAIMANGPTKGCEPETFALLKSLPSIEAVFQLHRNERRDGNVNNVAPEYIANPSRDCQGNLVKLSVAADGQKYTVSIPATTFSRSFDTRSHE